MQASNGNFYGYTLYGGTNLLERFRVDASRETDHALQFLQGGKLP